MAIAVLAIPVATALAMTIDDAETVPPLIVNVAVDVPGEVPLFVAVFTAIVNAPRLAVPPLIVIAPELPPVVKLLPVRETMEIVFAEKFPSARTSELHPSPESWQRCGRTSRRY